jgi:UDP-N-acetylmuramyl pentapeptide phosphotransferase/UDP-N-acetylglucosamine-1-phosphate transferase
MPMLGVHNLINKEKIQLAIFVPQILANYMLPVIKALAVMRRVNIYGR